MRAVKVGDNVRTEVLGEGVVTKVIDTPEIAHGYDVHVKLPQYESDLAFKRNELTRIPKHRGKYDPEHWGEKDPDEYSLDADHPNIARYRKSGPAN